MVNDIRDALRLLLRNPGFSIVVCLTLALGVGASTAIFSVVDAALFRPLPYKDSDRLVDVFAKVRTRSGDPILIQADGLYAERLRAIRQVFEGLEVFSDARPKALAIGSDMSPRIGAFTPGFPGFLGVGPQLGRSFTPDDVLAGGVIIISDGYWQRAFNRSRDVVGKTIAFANQRCVVIGVMPPTFRYFVGAKTDAWLPLVERNGERLAARLRTGLTLGQAQRELNAVLTRPETASKPLTVEIRRADWNRGGRSSTMLLSLLGAVGCVLMIACANVANLLLSRSLTRKREIAVRSALGATRLRLARQLLMESLVLAGVSSVGAVTLGWSAIRFLPVIVPADLTNPLLGVSLPQLDVRVVAFGCAAAVLTGVLCGAMPAVRGSRADAADGLFAHGQRISGASRPQRRLGYVFQSLQVAMTLVLLVGAGLLGASFIRMVTVPTGFDGEALGYATLTLPQTGYTSTEQRRRFLDDLVARVRLIPGITAATVGPPPVAGYTGESFMSERGDGEALGAVPLETFHVRPDYFRVAGIPLKQGRTFGSDDQSNAPRVAIISENAAKRFWPDQSAIGQAFRSYVGDHTSSPGAPRTIVGVVPHIRTIQLATDGVEAYLPEQQSGVHPGLLFRMTGEAASSVFSAIRSEIRTIDADVILTRIGTVDGLYAEFDPTGSPRFYTLILTLFAAIGLITAGVGLYGLLSYSVSRRTHEIGVRVALGADVARIRLLVIADAMVPVVVGMALGLAAALGLSRFLASQLFQIERHDPMTFSSVVMLLLLVSVAAAYVPVRRATNIDPANALRTE